VLKTLPEINAETDYVLTQYRICIL
jgi:hypothetical protein